MTRAVGEDEMVWKDSTAAGSGADTALALEEQSVVHLVVQRGESVTTLSIGDGETLTIGRAADASIPVPEASVSRKHAEIRRTGRMLFVEDHGSRNGLEVNQQIVRAAVRRLRSGDTLSVGSTQIFVVTTFADARWSAGAQRLEDELERQRSIGPAVLCRIAVVADETVSAIESLADALRDASVVEARAEGELAALFPGLGVADVDMLVERLQRERPDAAIRAVSVPSEKLSFASLWAQLTSESRSTSSLPRLEGIVAADPAMLQVFQLAARVAQSPSTALLLGETGVGKDVVAHQIHQMSTRVAKPFLRLNCSSMPESLVESVLFGHERGAFTGADRRKVGYFEAADGGTLFLDEIGEMPLSAQAKLLVALETRKISRVGSTTELPVDVRLVCATNRDLRAEIAKGRFREDLFFRIGSFTITIPPLRARKGEIPLLAQSFAQTFSSRMALPTPTLAPETLAVLLQHPWPGNIRELRNVIEHGILMAESGTVLPEHLPPLVRSLEPDAPTTSPKRLWNRVSDDDRASIVAALEADGWNQVLAARRLGMSRRMLIYRMQKHGIARPTGPEK